MSLMENVSSAYDLEDGQRVEAIAKTLMAEFYGRELTALASDKITLRAMALKGEPRAMKCVEVAGVLVNYMREELE